MITNMDDYKNKKLHSCVSDMVNTTAESGKKIGELIKDYAYAIQYNFKEYESQEISNKRNLDKLK